MLAAISSNLKISDLFKGDLQLTSPPNIYFELQKTIENPSKSITDISFIIEKDNALSIRTLKIVNSAFFGLPEPIASISRAITVIGMQALQSLVLATVIIDKFSTMPEGLLSMHDFWARSLRCALLSKELGSYRKIKEDSDTIFICGLLHDIGQLVFYRRIPDLARQIGLLVESSCTDEIETENNMLGFNHYQTGAELAMLWRLPEIIVATIGQHNDPDPASLFAEAAAIITAANYLCKRDETNISQNGLCNNIPPNDLADIINEAETKFEAIFKLFYSA